MSKFSFIISAALALCAASMLFSCGAAETDVGETGENEISGDKKAPESAAVNDESEEKPVYNISVKSLRPTEKTAQTGAVTDNPAALSLYMAKNEREELQLVLSSDKEISGLDLRCDCELECELLRVAYVPCGEDRLPDPVAPLKSGFRLNAGQNLAVICRFRSYADTPAGVYPAKFTISLGDETVSVTEASVKIWDFALPDESYCRTAFGLSAGFINNAHGSHDDGGEMYKRYYDYLLDNHMCAYSLPYDILDSRADAYMSDPRVNMFIIPYGSDEEIKAYYEKLSSNPDWFRKGVFYPLDEPTNGEMLDRLTEIGTRLGKLYPGYKMVTPFFTNITHKGRTQVENMTGVTNVWCPKLFCFDSDKTDFSRFSEQMADRQAAGDEVWWYVCWEPGKPYTNLYVDEDGLDHRLMFWQQRAADVTGFLYWSANYWQYTPDPWQSMTSVPHLSKTVYGDGSLLYTGVPVGIDGPCGSLRIIDIADGIEDFDLLTLAIDRLGREKVDGIISKVTQSPRKYTSDDEVLFEARREIGEALSANG